MQQVFVAAELRFGVLHVTQDPFLAFEQLQPHVCRAEVARDAYKVVEPCAAAVCEGVAACAAHGRDPYDEARERGARIAPDKVCAVLFAGEAYALVEVVERLDRHLRRDAERYEQLFWPRVHGQHVAYGCGDGLVPQMFQREVREVEVYPLEQRVGGDDSGLVLRGGYDGGVVAHAREGRGGGGGYACREAVDEPELSEFGYFGSFLFAHVMCCLRQRY